MTSTFTVGYRSKLGTKDVLVPEAPGDLNYPNYLTLGLSAGSACQTLLLRPSDALVLISSPIPRDMRREALPVELLATWAKFNGVKYGDVEIRKITSGIEDRGAGVFALHDLQATIIEPSPLMVIPQGLILSLPLVGNHAKSDKHLREVLEAVGEFGRTARGAILIFLLMQITDASPDNSDSIGVSSPLREYVKFLPVNVPLPTFYSESELKFLHGTSLEAALEAKLNSLTKEFEVLRESTEAIPWCRKIWWDEGKGILSINDWKQVDAWYRSRALDLPETGHAMVPCMDMANHASGDDTSALYGTSQDGDAVLQLRDTKSLSVGEEVTITYGDEKGACEMLYSYGFIEESMKSARELFLELEIPDDDPLKLAKLRISNCPPGFKLFDSLDKSGWEGDFVWWSCINEEDGLIFSVLRTNDGERELKVAWKNEEIYDTANLKAALQRDKLWDIFQLRAIVVLQTRLDQQMTKLNENTSTSQLAQRDRGVRYENWTNISRLRELEWQLLAKGYQDLEQQKGSLLESEVVKEYLATTTTVDLDTSDQDSFT